MSAEETPLDGYITYAIAAAHRKVTQSLSDGLKRLGVQIEAWRVMELLEGDTRPTMGELARMALMNPPTLSKLVDRMVSDGLVHRKVAQSDQRQVNLLLTDLGRKRMLEVRQEVIRYNQDLESTLSAGARETLIRLLSQLH